MTFVRTFKRRRAFLDQLTVGDSESAAARAADGTVAQFKKWRNEDKDFAADWDDAVEAGTDFIEDIATERAMRKSDPLMLAILKARRPDKYDRNAGKNGVEVTINVEGAKAKLLNKVARLQAQGKVSSDSDPEESQVSGDQAEEGSPEQLRLPPPDPRVPGAGSKRRR